MKIAVIVAVAIAVLIVLLEVSLRGLFGFGNPLIYIADEKIGYLLAPNQQVKRFGNRIAINRYSMRSPEVSPTRSPDTFRALLLGDSVANGGWWTDQSNTISEMLMSQVQPLLTGNTLQRAEVLNASANSWGPRNELAYLQRFGHFDAQVILLLINTDDLFGTAPTSVQVGRDLNYPDRKPPSALAEVFSRYLFKQGPIPELAAVQAEGGDRVGVNLEAIRQIRALIAQANGALILGMTPLLREIGTPGSRDYEIKARQRLKDFTASEQIPYVDFLPIFNAVTQPKTLYRDHIHLSSEGNRVVSQKLTEALKPFVLKLLRE